MTIRRSAPRCAPLLLAFLAVALPAACTRPVNGDPMSEASDHDAAWEQVRSAPDDATQQQRLIGFLRSHEQAGAPALQVLVYRRDTGAQARIDDALWANPDQHEVELRFGERRYRFVPRSRASLEPLFRE